MQYVLGFVIIGIYYSRIMINFIFCCIIVIGQSKGCNKVWAVFVVIWIKNMKKGIKCAGSISPIV